MFAWIPKISVKYYGLFVISLFFAQLNIVKAQSLVSSNNTMQPAEVGFWASKENDGVFHIYACGAELCGRFVGMQYTTPLPPTSKQGNSQCNFLMLRHFLRDKSGKKWSGTIYDPRDEKGYNAKIWLSNKGELKVRGYLGITLLGETHTWHRYDGTILQNCRLSDSK